MANKCVTVLAPNGRRQNVKVTPNTTVLQVLEEVCKKQGFKPEEYDITHHNKVVDAMSPLRFTGLPNNAQLEMALATRIRSESKVKVGLTLENGDRLVGEFEPSESLWGIITALCPNEGHMEGIPAVVYMGREVTGEEHLRETTLRSLGLARGGAVLRFFKRRPGHVHEQANVSAPLRKLPPASSNHPKKKHVSVMQPATQTIIPTHPLDTPPEPVAAEPVPTQPVAAEPVPTQPVVAEPVPTQPVVAEPVPSEPMDTGAQPTEPLQAVQSKKEDQSVEEPRKKLESCTQETAKTKGNEELLPSASISEMDYEDTSVASTSADSTSRELVKTASILNQKKEEESIVFLGERNAVVFDLSNSSGTVEEVPDDFFDLTLDDARQLLRDHKRHQAELEGAPLLTSQQRELEKSKLLLTQLNQYRQCVVRVQFPDRLVLQGIFSPLDSFSVVMDFVRTFLQYPEAEFHLFVTPPKTILPPEQTLVGAGCVPCTLVHFGYSSGAYDKFLKDDIAVRISSPRGAAIAARQSRGLSVRPANIPVLSSPGIAQLISGPSSTTTSNTRPTQTSSNSGSGPVSSTSTAAETMKNQATDKVPKWFRPGK